VSYFEFVGKNLSIQLKDKFVRVEMFRDYVSRKNDSSEKSWNCLLERDKKHKNLNEEWDLKDPDGSYSSGKKIFSQDSEYPKIYDKIDEEGKIAYLAANNEFDNWKKFQKFSIYEYLLFQDCNLTKQDLDHVLSKANIRDGLIFDSKTIHSNHRTKKISWENFKGN